MIASHANIYMLLTWPHSDRGRSWQCPDRCFATEVRGLLQCTGRRSHRQWSWGGSRKVEEEHTNDIIMLSQRQRRVSAAPHVYSIMVNYSLIVQLQLPFVVLYNHTQFQAALMFFITFHTTQVLLLIWIMSRSRCNLEKVPRGKMCVIYNPNKYVFGPSRLSDERCSAFSDFSA